MVSGVHRFKWLLCWSVYWISSLISAQSQFREIWAGERCERARGLRRHQTTYEVINCQLPAQKYQENTWNNRCHAKYAKRSQRFAKGIQIGKRKIKIFNYFLLFYFPFIPEYDKKSQSVSIYWSPIFHHTAGWKSTHPGFGGGSADAGGSSGGCGGDGGGNWLSWRTN